MQVKYKQYNFTLTSKKIILKAECAYTESNSKRYIAALIAIRDIIILARGSLLSIELCVLSR